MLIYIVKLCLSPFKFVTQRAIWPMRPLFDVINYTFKFVSLFFKDYNLEKYFI